MLRYLGYLKSYLLRTVNSRLIGAEWLSIISMADEIGEVLSLGGLSNGRTIVTRMDTPTTVWTPRDYYST